MCCFALKDCKCLLQKLSKQNYKFTDDQMRWEPHECYSKQLEKANNGLYGCYRYWMKRGSLGGDPAGITEALHGIVYGIPPNRENDHYSSWQVAWDMRCFREDGFRLVRKTTICPQFNGAIVCEPRGEPFPDAFCPLLQDAKYKLQYGFYSTIRDFVAPKEIA